MLNNTFDINYKTLLAQIIDDGHWLETRGTRSKYLFCKTLQHDLRKGFPASTLRNIYPTSALHEMYQFDLQGYGLVTEEFLTPGLLKVWKNYCKSEENYIAHSYCENWRSWPVLNFSMQEKDVQPVQYIDQLVRLVDNLIADPTSRSHVVQTLNPGASYANSGMPNCGITMVFSSEGTHLDLHVTSRSQDAVTGLPGDVVRYSALLTLIARLSGLIARQIAMTATNLHIYESSIADAEAIIASRLQYELPTLQLSGPLSLNLQKNQYKLINYKYTKGASLQSTLELGDLSAYK